MEGNFSCSSCSSSASFFCICQPKKLYLCPQCIPEHCLKGGAHSIIPITAEHIVSTHQDIDAYNKQREAAQELVGLLDTMQVNLATERDQLGNIINLKYTEQTNQLYAAYVTIGADLDSVYQQIGLELQRIKEEIQTCLQKRVESPSFDTTKFVGVAAHVCERFQGSIPILEELEKRVKIVVSTDPQPESAIGRLMTTWDIPYCQCQKCLFYQYLFVIPTGLSPPCVDYPNATSLVVFPCCDRPYPCSLCHDRKEAHKMVPGNSGMYVCRGCSRKQEMTEKCCECGAQLTWFP